MKKYLSGLIAVVFAIMAFSFTTTKNSATSLYWFRYTGTAFIFDQFDENPSISCTPSGLNSCAEGYQSATSDGQGGYIYPGTNLQSELKKQ